MDEREAELLREIAERRAELVTRAEGFRKSFVTSLDPREKVRQHPISALGTSLLAGVALALASPRRADRHPGSAVGAILRTVLPGLLQGVVPGLLLGLITPILTRVGLPSTPETNGSPEERLPHDRSHTEPAADPVR